VWRTERRGAAARELIVRLNDGTQHNARFAFAR
jgi:hypothetical protein